MRMCFATLFLLLSTAAFSEIQALGTSNKATGITGSTSNLPDQSDQAQYFKLLIKGMKKQKKQIVERSAYLKSVNNSLATNKSTQATSPQQITAQAQTDATIKKNEEELAKLATASNTVNSNITKVEKITAELSPIQPASSAQGSSACMLRISNYSAWGFSKITMVGSGGSSLDNSKEREIANGQSAYIESDKMTFQSPCINKSFFYDNWAFDSKIHQLYQKATGKRGLGLICRNGEMKTQSLRNHPEGADIDDILYGCNGECEQEIIKCPDIEKYCQVGSPDVSSGSNGVSIGTKWRYYLDGESIVADYSMASGSALFPAYLPTSSTPSATDTLKSCKSGDKGYEFSNKGKFSCNGSSQKWTYVSNAISGVTEMNYSPVPGGYSKAYFTEMITKLPSCNETQLNHIKSYAGTLSTFGTSSVVTGVYSNPAFAGVSYNISQNISSGTLGFSTGGFQNMEGSLSYVSDKVYKGLATHTPGDCKTLIPFEITLTFSSSDGKEIDKADYLTTIQEDGCGMTKGQSFTGALRKSAP
ncbi:MAG: hypothetical protein K2Q18_17095 [Bdellovibrionales bacterium]|nr:hypothetical protein [Bdellovibrionales bacterium]